MPACRAFPFRSGPSASPAALATTIDLSIRAIQKKIAGRARRGIIGEITKRARVGAIVA